MMRQAAAAAAAAAAMANAETAQAVKDVFFSAVLFLIFLFLSS